MSQLTRVYQNGKFDIATKTGCSADRTNCLFFLSRLPICLCFYSIFFGRKTFFCICRKAKDRIISPHLFSNRYQRQMRWLSIKVKANFYHTNSWSYPTAAVTCVSHATFSLCDLSYAPTDDVYGKWAIFVPLLMLTLRNLFFFPY